MGYPALLADGTLVDIDRKELDANGNEVYIASDGAKYTRNFANAPGNDAVTLYEYDEASGEPPEDNYAETRAVEGVSISDIHTQNKQYAAEVKAEQDDTDLQAVKFGGETVAGLQEQADNAADTSVVGDDSTNVSPDEGTSTNPTDEQEDTSQDDTAKDDDPDYLKSEFSERDDPALEGETQVPSNEDEGKTGGGAGSAPYSTE